MTGVAELAELVRRETGVRLVPGQHPALVAALARAWPRIDPPDFLRLAADPVAGRHAVARLIDEVTVKETFFLRDRRQLEAIDWSRLHDGARRAGSDTIRVWSAACATGEEPYSLALLAAEAFAPADAPVRILATDISEGALRAAAVGRYRERSLHGVDEPHRSRYFDPADDLVVGERLKRNVRFALHNLVRDPLPPAGHGPFDLIVCRNVLIYFDAETAARVVAGLERAVAPGGELVLGAADVLCGVETRLADLIAGSTAPPRLPVPVRALRQPLGRVPERSFADRLAETMRAADEGRSGEALAAISVLIAENTLDPDLYFVRGLVELQSGDAAAAAWSLRRALYLEPAFGLAAFKLGRAHEELGDSAAACRAYEQALRSLGDDEGRHERLLAQIDSADVRAACTARLEALSTGGVAR